MKLWRALGRLVLVALHAQRHGRMVIPALIDAEMASVLGATNEIDSLITEGILHVEWLR